MQEALLHGTTEDSQPRKKIATISCKMETLTKPISTSFCFPSSLCNLTGQAHTHITRSIFLGHMTAATCLDPNSKFHKIMNGLKWVLFQ